MTHACDSILVCCIDFRFQKYVRDWTDKNLKGKTFDLVGFAGSTKELNIIMGQIEISERLHHIKRAVLIHHEDCGAYGSEGSYERHKEDLLKAKASITEKFPTMEISLYYLKLDGSFVDVLASETE